MSLRPSTGLLSCLLRADVIRCADQQAWLSDSRVGRFADRPGDPEVGDYRVALVQQDVLRLNVAVDHPVPVSVVQCLGDFPRQLERDLDVEPGLAVEAVTQRAALDIRDHVVERPVCVARVVERENIGMAELGRHPDLAEEPLRPQHLGQMRPQDLQSDIALVLEVAREIDHSHAAVADLALDRVSATEGGRHLVLQFGQTDFREGSPLQYHRPQNPARDRPRAHALIAAASTAGTRVQLEFSSKLVIRCISR